MATRVLVIEDDLEARNLLKDRLAQAGFEPLLAATGSEGMRLLYSYRPSMVLLDIVLPGMDGWETCRRIREACDVPIVIVSGKNSKNDIVRGFELGADDFISKPVDHRELLRESEPLWSAARTSKEKSRMCSTAKGCASM